MNPSFQPLTYGGASPGTIRGGEGANWVSVSGASTYVHGNANAFHHQEVTIKRLQEDLKNAHNEQI
jgi:hypothetical protein